MVLYCTGFYLIYVYLHSLSLYKVQVVSKSETESEEDPEPAPRNVGYLFYSVLEVAMERDDSLEIINITLYAL